MIIEFKISNTKADMHADAGKGLEQIEVKKYRAMLHSNVTELREYGIAFYRKNCDIVGRALRRNRSSKGMRPWRATTLPM